MSNLPQTPPTPAILLCAPTGRFQESLRILLSSGFALHLVGPVAEARSALALAQAWHPALVVLDFALPEAELSAILNSLQSDWPNVGQVALVDSVDQLTEAKAWGIKQVLLRGFRLEELYTAITSQLNGGAVSAQPNHNP